MAGSASSSSVNKSLPYMYCQCGTKMRIFTSWTRKNPGRRFVKCRNIKTRSCTSFNFIDDELPSEYYKDLFYELHEEAKNSVGSAEQQEDSNLQMLQAMKELTLPKPKSNDIDKVFYLLIGVIAILSIVIVVLVL
uniref:uncharacterized protein LOC122601779 n=1 Tax=Erigeron canadensis TaxID=72917 RepID=UPI001CB9BB54|nr:uncharacterized protein LOC122601779 [Erigeron canadensis]